MEVMKVQQVKQPTFGYRIKKNILMKNVFEYNRNLLNNGDFKPVLIFCEAISNIYKRAPIDEIFSCNGSLGNLEGVGNVKNIGLNLVVNSVKDDYSVYSKFKLSKQHFLGEKNPYIDAKNALIKSANDVLIKEGSVSKFSPPVKGNDYIQGLIQILNNKKSKAKEENLLRFLMQKLNYLESKMS